MQKVLGTKKQRRTRTEDTIKKSGLAVICMIYSADHTISVWFLRQERSLFSLRFKYLLTEVSSLNSLTAKMIRTTSQGNLWEVLQAILMMVSVGRRRSERLPLLGKKVRNEDATWETHEDSDSKKKIKPKKDAKKEKERLEKRQT